MELQVGVKVFLKNSEGRILLLHRSTKKYPSVNNLWDIAGGRIDTGTPLIENLKREVYEETGLEITDGPQLIAAQDILKPPDMHVVRITYRASAEGTPTLSDEHDSFKWFTLEELQSLEGLDRYAKECITKGLITA